MVGYPVVYPGVGYPVSSWISSIRLNIRYPVGCPLVGYPVSGWMSYVLVSSWMSGGWISGIRLDIRWLDIRYPVRCTVVGYLVSSWICYYPTTGYPVFGWIFASLANLKLHTVSFWIYGVCRISGYPFFISNVSPNHTQIQSVKKI